jgi:electron transfer flavoprotein beta subunit
VNILTLLKQVPTAETRIRVAGGVVDLEGASFEVDGMDEYGIEEALRLREGGVEGDIVAVALGPDRFEDALRTALALGADRAVHVATDAPLDPVAQARVLAKLALEVGAELVLVGGKQADWDSAALGPAVAEALGWPHSDWTTSISIDGGALTATHDTDDGVEQLTLPLPAVVTTQQGLNEPRYPTLPNIMKAKRKELRTTTLEALGGAEPTIERLSEEVQTGERLRRTVEGSPADAAAELVALLRREAKVL